MKKNNQFTTQVITRYTSAFCRVEQYGKEKSLGSDLHFNSLARTLALRIRRSQNARYILEDSYGNSTTINIGEPYKQVVCTIKGIELCYKESKLY